jgi:chromosome segregation ATPase
MALSKVQIDNLKELYNSLQHNLSDISKILNEKHSELKEVLERLRVAGLDLDNTKVELEQSRKEIFSINKSVAERQDELKKEEELHQINLQETVSLISEKEGRHRELSNKIHNIESEISLASAEITNLDSLIVSKKEELLSIEADIRIAQADLRDVDLEFSSKVRELTDLETSKQKELQAFVAQKKELENEIIALRGTHSSYYNTLLEREENIKTKESDLNILEARLRMALEKNNIHYKL